MLVSKERAEYLSQLSYRYCKINNMMDKLITYKKAMELDSETAESIIRDLESKLSVVDMEISLLSFNAKSKYIGNSLIEIDNYQYVESYEYDYNRMNLPTSIKVNMHEGGSFNLVDRKSVV